MHKNTNQNNNIANQNNNKYDGNDNKVDMIWKWKLCKLLKWKYQNNNNIYSVTDNNKNNIPLVMKHEKHEKSLEY